MAIVKISDLPLVSSPVEGTDLFVVVQDNVTKKAYASDIQTYVGFEEFQTATAGQTVFNLTTMTYAAGANNLQVFVDGVNQYVGTSYVETDNNTVTFTQGLHEGALVKFSTVQTQTSLVNNAGAVTFLQAGTGAIPRSVQSKERDIVSVKDFGAVGDGVTPDDVAFTNAIAYAASVQAAIYVPGGATYRLNNPVVIPSRVRIYGDGKDLTRISSYSNGDVFRIVDGALGGLSGMTIDAMSNNANVVGIHLIATIPNAQQPQAYTFDDLRIRSLNPAAGQIGLYLDASALGASQATFNKFTRLIIQNFDQPQKEVGGNEQNVFIDVQIIQPGVNPGTADCVYSESNASQYLAYQFQKNASAATTIYGFHFASVPWGTQLNVAEGVADVGNGALIRDEGDNNTITGQAFAPTTKGSTTSNFFVNPIGSQRDASIYEVNAISLTGQNRSVFQAGVSGFSNGFSINYRESSPTQQMRYELINGPIGLCRLLPTNALYALPHIPVNVTASLPPAGATQDGAICIEDTGSGHNLIYYAGTARYRITGVSF